MSDAESQPAHGQPIGLLLLLSATAGATDAIGFLALHGLFTAHVTGDIVVLASHLVIRGNAGVAQLISVPVFMVVLGSARLLGLALDRRGNGTTSRLSCCFILFFCSIPLFWAFPSVRRLTPMHLWQRWPACAASRPWRSKTPLPKRKCPALLRQRC